MMFKSEEDEQLLFEYMTNRQIKDYKETGRFWVVAPDRRVYQLSDGQSVWRYRDRLASDSRHVWASNRGGRGRATKEASLLTQLLFLTSNSSDVLVSTGCGESTFMPIQTGCPPMRGWKAKNPRKVKMAKVKTA